MPVTPIEPCGIYMHTICATDPNTGEGTSVDCGIHPQDVQPDGGRVEGGTHQTREVRSLCMDAFHSCLVLSSPDLPQVEGANGLYPSDLEHTLGPRSKKRVLDSPSTG
ncbi:hypothetical protein MAPG_06496 [Magnaporthiopsis poae ATCC 64411]|uniref:Uncharacterized protein n=1 Tax=Magnaporthiopsis poae (strain ATCC 64411 / 73-15) TaxID=644358 RepID=A0A0C4E267_MAGP6|nr:hypothetical protein MAPG_06496 [Magnaporthiopsis poae ATCC 64411]